MNEKEISNNIGLYIINPDYFNDNEETEKEIKEYKKESDDYFLCGTGNPSFIDTFMEDLNKKFKETVANCTKPADKSLKNYREGYFNELVQNANDAISETVRCGDFKCTVSKEDNIYTVTCSYPDEGFDTKDIYGFCTKENSNKEQKKGQVGNFGIGIKSLFRFVDSLEVNSNFNISYNNKRKSNKKTEVEWVTTGGKRTEIKFSFTYRSPGDGSKANDNDTKKNSFNVSKLAEFIDALIAGNKEEAEKYLFNYGSASKTVFDIRALMLMDMRGEREQDNCITRLSFNDLIEVTRNIKEVVLTPQLEEIKQIRIGSIIINDDKKCTYLIFHFTDDIIVAFPYDFKYDPKKDRLYSTYFIDVEDTPFYDVSTGCLVSTNEINATRSDIDKENVNDNNAINKIKKHIVLAVKALTYLMIDQRNQDKYVRGVISDVFCQLIYEYRNMYGSYSENLIPGSVFSGLHNILCEAVANIYFNEGKNYIQKKDGGLNINYENKLFNEEKQVDEKDEYVAELFRVFESVFLKDDILDWDKDKDCLTSGIKNLAKFFFLDTNGESWVNAFTFPFINGEKELVKRRLKGNNTSNVLDFISKHPDDGSYIRKILGRLKVVDFLDFEGNFNDNTIRGWLFDDIEKTTNDNELDDNGLKTLYDNYEKNYSGLKSKLKEKDEYNRLKYIGNSKYRRRFYWAYFNNNNTEGCYYFTSLCDDLPSLPLEDDEVLSLLDLIKKKRINIGRNIIVRNNRVFIFIHNQEMTINSADYEYDDSVISNDKVKFFYLDNNATIKDFESFKKIRTIIEEIDNDLKHIHWRDYFFKVFYKCEIEKANSELMKNIFEWLAPNYGRQISYKDKPNTIIFNPQITVSAFGDDIVDTKLDIIDFIHTWLKEKEEKDIVIKVESLSLEDVKMNGRKYIGYITNWKTEKPMIYVRKAKSASFECISESCNQPLQSEDTNKKHLVIFHNCKDDIQSVLTDVLKDCMHERSLCYYVENYINTENRRKLLTSEYDRFTKREVLGHDFGFTKDDYPRDGEEFKKILDDGRKLDKSSPNDIYSNLSKGHQYDDFCPICNRIPTLIIKETDETKKIERRNSLIAVIRAKLNDRDDTIFIKLPCCKSCFDEYKSSLTFATLDLEADIPTLTLECVYEDGIRLKHAQKVIKLAPLHWAMIKSSMTT